jgi:GTP-binding protein
MIEDYLRKRKTLVNIFVLVDARHTPQQIDFDFVNDLGGWKLPFAIVYTKADKEKPGAVQRNINLFFAKMRESWQFLPQYFVTSAISKQGREDILNFIDDCNKTFAEHKQS